MQQTNNSQAGERTQKLSRAEVNRRLQALTIDPWGHLSGKIGNAFVNAWASGKNRRIDRISVYGVQHESMPEVFMVAKKVKAATGLIVHFSFGKFISKTF